MAIGFGNSGASGTGTTSAAPAYPASLLAGDLMVIGMINKYPNNAPTDPSGWTRVAQTSGGHGSSGVDAGNVYVTVYTKVSVGTETGTITINVPSGNACVARMFNLTKAAGATWDIIASVGAFNSGGSTAWSVTGDVDPGFNTNDFMVAVSGVNGNATGTFSAEAISATGATFGSVTERNDNGTSNGDDCKLVIATCAVTGGPSAAAPVYTMTGSASSTDYPAGATVMLRIRELQPYMLARQSINYRTALVAASM